MPAEPNPGIEIGADHVLGVDRAGLTLVDGRFGLAAPLRHIPMRVVFEVHNRPDGRMLFARIPSPTDPMICQLINLGLVSDVKEALRGL